MIDIKKLTEADVDKTVIFKQDSSWDIGPIVEGKIVAWGINFIIVDYGDGKTSVNVGQAKGRYTQERDLSFKD